jgi:hypothetical protein
MKKIQTVKLGKMRGELHLKFLTTFRHMLEENPEIKEYILPALWYTYNSFLELETKLVDAARASSLTKQLEEADAHVDRDIVGINAVISAALHHFNPDVVRAAGELQLRLKAFGRIDSKSYEEESMAVTLLLGDLTSNFSLQVELLGLQDWVDDLTAANAEFDSLFEQRNTELADRPSEKLVDVRKKIDGFYHGIIDRLEAVVVLEPSSEKNEFVRKLNEEIRYFNDHVHHPTRISLKHATVDPIDPQPWTGGQPVTPIPAVRMEDRRLGFARDFTVDYRDNEERGTATIIIRGRGKYIGQREATFNIV